MEGTTSSGSGGSYSASLPSGSGSGYAMPGMVSPGYLAARRQMQEISGTVYGNQKMYQGQEFNRDEFNRPSIELSSLYSAQKPKEDKMDYLSTSRNMYLH